MTDWSPFLFRVTGPSVESDYWMIGNESDALFCLEYLGTPAMGRR